MAPEVARFNPGEKGILLAEFGMNAHFPNRPAAPKLPEMVSSTEPRLATANDAMFKPRGSRTGAAGARHSLADDATARGEMEAN